MRGSVLYLRSREILSGGKSGLKFVKEYTFRQTPASLRTQLFFNISIVITDQKFTVHQAFSTKLPLRPHDNSEKKKYPGYRWAITTGDESRS